MNKVTFSKLKVFLQMFFVINLINSKPSIPFICSWTSGPEVFFPHPISAKNDAGTRFQNKIITAAEKGEKMQKNAWAKI